MNAPQTPNPDLDPATDALLRAGLDAWADDATVPEAQVESAWDALDARRAVGDTASPPTERRTFLAAAAAVVLVLLFAAGLVARNGAEVSTTNTTPAPAPDPSPGPAPGPTSDTTGVTTPGPNPDATTDPTTPTGADQLLLSDRGIGPIAFGTDINDAVGSLTDRLGEPSMGFGWPEVGETTTGTIPSVAGIVSWGGLMVEFDDAGRMAAWSVRAPSIFNPGSVPAEVRPPSGFALGMTRAQFHALGDDPSAAMPTDRFTCVTERAGGRYCGQFDTAIGQSDPADPLISLSAGTGDLMRDDGRPGPSGVPPTTTSTTTRPTTPTTTPPAVEEVRLLATGIGTMPFGTDTAEVLAVLTARLGSWSEDSGWVESGDIAFPVRHVGWGPLLVTFGRRNGGEELVGWNIGRSTTSGPVSAQVVIGPGLRLEMTVAELRAIDPDLWILGTEQGPELCLEPDGVLCGLIRWPWPDTEEPGYEHWWLVQFSAWFEPRDEPPLEPYRP